MDDVAEARHERDAVHSRPWSVWRPLPFMGGGAKALQNRRVRPCWSGSYASSVRPERLVDCMRFRATGLERQTSLLTMWPNSSWEKRTRSSAFS